MSVPVQAWISQSRWGQAASCIHCQPLFELKVEGLYRVWSMSRQMQTWISTWFVCSKNKSCSVNKIKLIFYMMSSACYKCLSLVIPNRSQSPAWANCSHTHLLRVHGLGEPCASFPDFCNNCQFHVIYCELKIIQTLVDVWEYLSHNSC